ncbi:MAG: TIGR01777 family protein [Myxococcales bacterium]|nr:MAG: TIGR01777 family protein [Myxococcales bacterium]
MSGKKIITVAGAGGVVGKHLIAQARKQGFRLRALSRRLDPGLSKDVEVFEWHPHDGAVQQSIVEALEGASIVANLAGASIGNGKLDADAKEKILKSRIDATNALGSAFEQCKNPPRVWLQASAVGYYGDTGERTVTEQSAAASDWFLADVCKQWEAQARHVEEAHRETLRMVIGRIGIVLAEDAPAWNKMLLPIKLGVGGKLGSGKQWYPWIDADDLARAFLFLAEREQSEGIYNLTAAQPVRQKDLAKQTARKIRRPAIFPAPAFALRALLGETADALVLASCKALPTRLLESGFVFEQPDIESELAKFFG